MRVALVALADPGQRESVVARLTRDGVRVAVIGECVAGAEFVLESGDDVSAVKRVEHELGALDILVCSVESPAPAAFAGADPVAWLSGVQECVSVPFSLVRAAAPALRRADDARIVLVGTGWGTAVANNTAAAAIQGAMVAFTKTLARDLGPQGILVNEIATSPHTEARDLAAAVAYLTSPGGAAMVGQVLTLGRGGEVRP